MNKILVTLALLLGTLMLASPANATTVIAPHYKGVVTTGCKAQVWSVAKSYYTVQNLGFNGTMKQTLRFTAKSGYKFSDGTSVKTVTATPPYAAVAPGNCGIVVWVR